MKRQWAILLMASIGSTALAEGIPTEFQGTWTVDSAATAKRIAAVPEMSDENKEYWTKRFTDGEESKIELLIDDKSVGMAVLGTFSVTEILETSLSRTSIAAVIRDPRSDKEWNVILDLQIEDGILNMNMDSGGEFDDDDFDRVMWAQRSGEAVIPAKASGDIVHYLDSLKTCAPGEFLFANTGLGKFQSSIVGRNGDRCRVITGYSGHRMVCDYDDTMITLLTSKQKYDDARNGILQGSSDSEESIRASEQCVIE